MLSIKQKLKIFPLTIPSCMRLNEKFDINSFSRIIFVYCEFLCVLKLDLTENFLSHTSQRNGFSRVYTQMFIEIRVI